MVGYNSPFPRPETAYGAGYDPRAHVKALADSLRMAMDIGDDAMAGNYEDEIIQLLAEHPELTEDPDE